MGKSQYEIIWAHLKKSALATVLVENHIFTRNTLFAKDRALSVVHIWLENAGSKVLSEVGSVSRRPKCRVYLFCGQGGIRAVQVVSTSKNR